ncbi:MAG: M50 family metallopeptidase [Solirubrobacterales bacterium]
MTWVLTIAGFGALIVLHEFGHFVVAKWTGMRVERFFLFFPPKLWSVKRGETEYGIGAIPLGGFVKITGMNPEELEPRDTSETPREAGLLERVESVDQEPGPGVSRPGEPLSPELLKRAYYNQPVWKRIVVIAAGPAMNLLIAFVILFALAFTIEEAVGPGVEIDQVQDDTPAAGKLEPADRIVSVDGVPASNLDFEDRIERFRDEVDTHKCAGDQTDGCTTATPVQLVVERDGRQVPVTVTPEYNADAERSLLGVVFGPVETQSAGYSVPEAANFAADRMWFITSRTISTIGRIFLPEQREQLSGPVGGSRALNEAIGFDWRDALLVLAVISLSLGLINLFPFLPLDGGHIFWSLVEKVRGERVPFRVIESASAFGFLLVMVLFAIGLSNDISNLGNDALNPR